jgi:tRNA pseudouridine synthase 10
MIEKARTLFEMGLCDRCVGRFFSDWLHGYTNPERGRKLREMLKENGYEYPERASCFLCGDVFSNIDEKAGWVSESLKDIEFDTFLIGSRFDKDVLEKEEEIRGRLELKGETIKVEFNRELGKALEKITGKRFSRDNPDIEILYDTRYDDIKVQINPVYIYGRYRKLIRGIPQTRWPCRYCHGKGCEHCNFTGKMYPESVEELVAHEFMIELQGKEHAFHGMGREDIDARMLGNGRPFVLEIKEPKKRHYDPKEMEKRVNQFASGKVEVHGLRPSSKAEVRKIKASRAEKTYVVEVVFEQDVDEEKLKKALHMLEGDIEQRTPRRVAHRRADLVRKRKALSVKLLELNGRRARIEIRGEAGLYIKELMHGDEGRTHPSLAEVLGVPCKVESLDVIEIHAKEE